MCLHSTSMLLQNQELLAAADNKLAELRKEYDVMLESKQIELSRHLKELSHKNDQVTASALTTIGLIFYYNLILD